MNITNLKEYAELLGLDSITLDSSRGWVRASCPFTEDHSGGVDKNPSFGLGFSTETGKPIYKCLACDAGGDAGELIHYIRLHNNVSTLDAQNYYISNLIADIDSPAAIRALPKRRKLDVRLEQLQMAVREDPMPVPDEILNKYKRVYDSESRAAHEVAYYLTHQRGVFEKQIKQYDLRVFDSSFGGAGIVFPIKSRNGTTYDLWVRMLESKAFFRLTPERTGSPVIYGNKRLWYGEQTFNQDKITIIVEGALDMLRLRSLGVTANVLASLGGPSHDQLSNTNVITRKTYVGYDADDAGATFTRKIVSAWGSPVIYLLDWSIASVTDASGNFVKVAKDPGDIQNKVEFTNVWKSAVRYLKKPIVTPLDATTRKRNVWKER